MNIAGPVLNSTLTPWYVAETLEESGVLGGGSSLKGDKKGSPQNSPPYSCSKSALRAL